MKQIFAKKSGVRMRLCALLTVWCGAAVLFAGCADIVNTEPVFVYGVGVDVDESGYQIHLLTGKSEDEGQGASSDADAGGAAGGEKDSGDTTAKNGEEKADSGGLTVLSFGGRTPEEAFEQFFRACQPVYSGTVRLYLLGGGVDDAHAAELGAYLINAGKLPLKRSIGRSEDPFAFFAACAGSMSEEAYQSRFEKEGMNAVAYFARAAAGKADTSEPPYEPFPTA